jgi:hypothetical protein
MELNLPRATLPAAERLDIVIERSAQPLRRPVSCGSLESLRSHC